MSVSKDHPVGVFTPENKDTVQCYNVGVIKIKEGEWK